MVVTTDLGIPKLTLYVGDLHPEVTEAILFERFSRMGPLSTVHVCRDVKTKKSLCYAYVNFQRPEDAARALKHMNYDTLKGRVMRLMWVERDRSVRRPNPSNLFIKNLDKDVTSRDLYQLLSSYGQIVSCKAAMDGTACKGYGFAQFVTPQEASAAVAGTNGLVFKGKPLYVGPFIPKSQRTPREKTFRNLYVKNLPADMDDEHLDTLFARFGTVTSAKVMRDSEGRSRRHGFVCFTEHEAAAKALKEAGGSLAEGIGEPLIVARAQTKAERSAELKENYEKEKVESSQRGVNLYVKHLAETIDDAELSKMFNKFGTVTSAKVARDATTGRSRRFGYVSMAAPEQAASAIKELHAPGQLYVGYWQPKSTRVASMQARNMQQMSMIQRDRTNVIPGGAYMPDAAAPRGLLAQRPPFVPRLGHYLPVPQVVPRAPMPGVFRHSALPQFLPSIEQMIQANKAQRQPVAHVTETVLTVADLANRSPQDIKLMLKEKVFLAIHNKFFDKARQITAAIVEKMAPEQVIGLLSHKVELYKMAQDIVLAIEAKGAATRK